MVGRYKERDGGGAAPNFYACGGMLCCVSPLGVQEKLGVMNKGLVYALWDYTAQQADELSFSEGDALIILRRCDNTETEWWWARLNDREGYVPRNLLGVSHCLSTECDTGDNSVG